MCLALSRQEAHPHLEVIRRRHRAQFPLQASSYSGRTGRQGLPFDASLPWTSPHWKREDLDAHFLFHSCKHTFRSHEGARKGLCAQKQLQVEKELASWTMLPFALCDLARLAFSQVHGCLKQLASLGLSHCLDQTTSQVSPPHAVPTPLHQSTSEKLPLNLN